MTTLWLITAAASALAADPAALRAGMEAPEGWESVETRTIDEVGPVAVRHKVVLGENCLEASATAKLDPDRLLAAATDVENQPKWSSWALPVLTPLARRRPSGQRSTMARPVRPGARAAESARPANPPRNPSRKTRHAADSLL